MKYIDTADSKRVREAINRVCNEQDMVVVSGERGAGKTTAVLDALARHKSVQAVFCLRLAREKLSASDCEAALITEISDEIAKNSPEARTRQLRRILGQASQQQNIVLVIDDAHVLHHRTLRALKRLRELQWMGKAPLLGIVMIAQRNPTQGIEEVALRTDEVILAGLSAAEARRFSQLRCVELGVDIEPAALDLIAGRNWLDLNVVLKIAARKAQASNRRKILVKDLREEKIEKLPEAIVASDEAVKKVLGQKAA